jgi:8-hydroxy-5-deazaflavin:NADPH oxidoreductase
MAALPSIAILGGTGDLGSALARRWAAAGYPVVIGSRTSEKAEALAREIGGTARGADNLEATRTAEIIVLAIPYSNHDAILQEIRAAAAGKIVLDAVVPLVPPKVSLVQLPPQGSAAQAAQTVLGPDVRVVSAFHNVSAKKLAGSEPVDCDVLVFGDDTEARKAIMALASAVGLRGVDGGFLANSVAAEALTAVLIGINRRYKVSGAGIRITGVPDSIIP